MNVSIQKNLEVTEVAEVQRVVIFDDFGHPVLLVRKMEEGVLLINRAGEVGFERALQLAGLNSRGARYVEAGLR